MAFQRKRKGRPAKGANRTPDAIDRALLSLKKNSEFMVNNNKIPAGWLLTKDEFNERKKLLATSNSRRIQAKPTDLEIEQYLLEKLTVIIPGFNSTYTPDEQNSKEKKYVSESVPVVVPDPVGDTTDEESYEVPSSATTRRRAASATKEKPSAIKERPSATKERPSATKERPSATKERPSATKERPSATRENPSATREKPSATKDKPSAIKEKSSVTKKVTIRKDTSSILQTPSPRTTRSKSPMVTVSKPFHCDHCEMSYQDASSLKKHTAVIHKNLLASRRRI